MKWWSNSIQKKATHLSFPYNFIWGSSNFPRKCPSKLLPAGSHTKGWAVLVILEWEEEKKERRISDQGEEDWGGRGGGGGLEEGRLGGQGSGFQAWGGSPGGRLGSCLLLGLRYGKGWRKADLIWEICLQGIICSCRWVLLLWGGWRALSCAMINMECHPLST